MKFLFNVFDINDFGHMMDWDHMMGWWGIPFIGFWSLLIWVGQIIVAVLVYKDAQKRKQNDLLWFILVILPWIGILFLIVYLIIREEEIELKESIEKGKNIIGERYAKGEITREEYLQIKKDLERKNAKINFF